MTNSKWLASDEPCNEKTALARAILDRSEAFKQMRKLLQDCIVSTIRLDEFEKNPLRSVYGENRTADQVTRDEVARLKHFDAVHRRDLIKLVVEIAGLTDWSAALVEAEAEAEALSAEARRLYDERMAARTVEVEVELAEERRSTLIDVELPA